MTDDEQAQKINGKYVRVDKNEFEKLLQHCIRMQHEMAQIIWIMSDDGTGDIDNIGLQFCLNDITSSLTFFNYSEPKDIE
jgi:hypothetical protein